MRNLESIFEELSHIEYMVKESNSSSNSELVYEAFWFVVNEGIGSWLGKKAGQVVNAVGGAAKSVADTVTGAVDWAKSLGEKVWGKIKELGQEFINWLKEVKAKIVEVINWAKSVPAKVWDSLQQFWAWLGEKVGNAINIIKNRVDAFISVMNAVVFEPISNAWKNVILNTELAYAYATQATSDKLLEMKDNINKFKGKCGAKWDSMVDAINKLLDKLPTGEQVAEFLKKIGKGIGLIVAGLLVSPFVAAFFLGKGAVALGGKLYELGETFVVAIEKAVGDFGQFVAQEAEAAKTAYSEERARVAPVVQKENVRNVLSFDQFLKRG